MLDSIRETFQSNHFLREKTYKVLSSSLITKNPLYKKIYNKRIQKVIQENAEFPKKVTIETTGHCNANCTMCTRDIMKRPLTVIDDQLFRSLIDQCAENGAEKVYLSGFGEPFMDPKLEEKVAYAKNAGIPTVSIFTNASLITETRAKKLLDAGIDEINISIDGFTEKTYEKIRQGLSFKIVTQNINNLLKEIEKRKSGPTILFEVVLLKENIHEKELAKKEWGSKVDNIIFRQPQSWVGDNEESLSVYTPHSSKTRAQRPPCHYIWTWLNIYADGTVPICCLDYDCSYNAGDATKATLKEIWQSEKYKSARNHHLQGKQKEIDICSKCNYFSVWW